MSRMFYFECLSGISGDMTVAALLDLGADRAALERMLKSLPGTEFPGGDQKSVKVGAGCV